MTARRRSRHGHRRRARRRAGPRRRWPLHLALLGVLVATLGFVYSQASARPADLRVADAFAAAWERGHLRTMYHWISATARSRYGLDRFVLAYESAAAVATAETVTTGRATSAPRGSVRLPVTVHTRLFGPVRGTVILHLEATAAGPRIAWSPGLRFPGLAGAGTLRRTVLPAPRGQILAADGAPMATEPGGTEPLGPAGQTIAGAVAPAGPPASGQTVGISGLERIYNATLTGRPGAQLRVGRHVLQTRAPVPGHTIRTTIDPAVQRVAYAALGSRDGAVAAVDPQTGAVLALAGLALSAAQPPGSTFKIITSTAALGAGLTTPSTTYPVNTAVTLDGYTLHNAGGEACGGTLINAFAVSCNSVFVPLGAAVGAGRLVAAAQAYGFDRTPRVVGTTPSSIPSAATIGDPLAVGSSAIGQGKVLATPLEMATVAATIADGGVRARPRLLATLPVQRTRVTTSRIAGEIRRMMLAVVRYGTGTAAQIPGLPVAAKTGTAELRTAVNPTASDPSNTDAWFVAFPAVPQPQVAVAVMLVGAGAGGASAAPIARQVLVASRPATVARAGSPLASPAP